MSRNPSYQGTIEEINAVRAKRNAEIRDWGKKVLADADAVLLGVPTEPSDWDDLEAAIAPDPEFDPTEQENLPNIGGDAQDTIVPKPTKTTKPKEPKPTM